MRSLRVKAKRQSFIATLLLLSIPLSAGAAEPEFSPEPQEKVVLKWLGNAGWEIQLGKTVILIDPFLTRKDRTMDAEWKTDEVAVLKVIRGADYIFAGHSHHDHIGDAAFIAKRFGSKIIGSRTTTNLMLTAGVDKSQVVTVSGGEKLDFKDFSVEVVESRHGIFSKGQRTGSSKFEEVLKPWSGPIMGRDFVMGGSYLYYFTFGKHRVLHQSTGNFIEDKLKGLQPDVALMNPGAPYDLAGIIKSLSPKIIIVHHFDDWWAPYSEGIKEANTGRARGFARKVREVDSQIKVIVPSFFMTYTLE